MSLINQLFNRGIFGAKCKTCLTLAISRMRLVQNKRDLQLKHMSKEIAQFLQAGQEPIARIRVEHVIREQNMWAAYEILELFCEFVLARVPIIESEKECPFELREAVASIIFAAPRCSEVPELLQLKNLFSTKYNKEFIMAASELRPDSGVNRDIIEKLSVHAPSAEARLKTLKQIALEHSVDWDSSKTEAELFKKHEDLLGGSKQIVAEDVPSQGRIKHSLPKATPSNGARAAMNSNREQGSQQIHAIAPNPPRNKPPPATDEIEPSMSYHDPRAGAVANSQMEPAPRPSDVLDKARAAIAYAERATFKALAAAELAKVDITSLKIEAKSTSVGDPI